MSTIIICSLVLTLIIVWVSYDYSKFKAKIAKSSNDISRYETECKQLRESEHHLKAVAIDLQTRLDQAVVDAVTGLVSWSLFEERFKQSLRESERYEFTLVLMLVDIDEFKVVNSALGYEIGDALLRAVAGRLRECTRQVDSISRFSKDTFAIMLPQLSKPETAAIIAQRMMQSIEAPIQIGSQELYVSICTGIAIYPTDGQDMATLMRCAERALKLAKENGKQTYKFYQERMNINSKRELELSTALRRDGISNEFSVFYEPILDVSSRAHFALEALLHWQHDELGLIDTKEVYNYATKQGKLNMLSEWLLHNAAKQFLYWRSLNFAPKYLSLPIAIDQFEHTNFIYRLSQILQDLDFRPQWLLLNIKTDNKKISEAHLDKAFNMFHYMGIKLCIDNFGTGLFTFKDLKNYKIDFLKLDPSLIEGVDKEERAHILLKSIIRMAEDLSIQVIAKNVENKQQSKVLVDLGCDLMQGDFVGEPISEKEVGTKITARQSEELT